MKEKCAERPVCAKLKEVLEECNERVEGKEKTSETCTQELFDFVHCVDDCVSALMFFFMCTCHIIWKEEIDWVKKKMVDTQFLVNSQR